MNEILGNLDSLRSAMDNSEFDAIIAMSPENVPYTSGVGIWIQKVLRDRLVLVVWPREGEPTLIVAINEEGYVREKSWITDVRSYSQHVDSPIKLLSDVLQEKGLGAGRIGFEPAYLTTDYYLELLDTMPEAKFESCEPLLQKVRMIKTDAEIDLLCRAATSTERALMATYSTARPGEKERDLVARLGANILQSGAELPALLNRTSSLPNDSIVLANRSRTESGSPTSVETAMALEAALPACSSVPSRGSMRRPARVTENPSSSKARADARPMPVPAPVTMATFVACFPDVT